MATPTVIKSWDFDAATDAVAVQTVLAYSGTTTFNKTVCDNLTGDFEGISLQGAGSWHIHHNNSKGSLAGKGLYNNNGGGRLFALLGLKAGDIVEITAGGGLPSSATNGTYDSENSTTGTHCIYTVTADGNFAVSVARNNYIHTVSITRDVADLEVPTFAITGANGTQREVTLDCITSEAVIKYNTTDDIDASGWTTYSTPFLTSESTLYAYSEKSGNKSSVVTITTGAGTSITLNEPVVSANFVENGMVYNPIYTFSSNQAGVVIGNPALSYTYTFNGGASTDGTSYAPTSNGSLTVTVSAEGYTSSSTTLSVFGGDFTRTYAFDAINDVTVDTEGGTWTNASNVNGAQWTFTGLENSSYELRIDMSLSGFMYARATTAKTKQGFYTRVSNGSINFTLKDGEAIVFSTLNGKVVANSSVTSQAFGQYTNVRSIEVYTPISEVDLAIAECKAYETSAAFATAIDAESFSSVAEVYAFHTAWQIAQAEGTTDYTKVLFNAGFELGTTSGWTIYGDASSAPADADKYGVVEDNGAGGYQYYTGWNGRNISQTITGLPAGVYRLTARVYSWAGGAPVKLFANGTVSAAENGEDHEPSLEFVVTGSEPTIKIGIGGDGQGSGDNTWGTWGYRVNYFTLTKVTASATLGANGYTTFASPYALDLRTTASVKAYKAAVEGTTVRFTELDQTVPANTGVLLEGTVGETISIPVVASGDDVSENAFEVNTAGTTFTAESGYTYYGLKKDSNPLSFWKFDPNTVAIPANKAYLKVANVGGVHALNVLFDDTTDGIQSVDKAQHTDGNYYDLSGRRVMNPTKGIYVKAGKKVVVK